MVADIWVYDKLQVLGGVDIVGYHIKNIYSYSAEGKGFVGEVFTAFYDGSKLIKCNMLDIIGHPKENIIPVNIEIPTNSKLIHIMLFHSKDSIQPLAESMVVN